MSSYNKQESLSNDTMEYSQMCKNSCGFYASNNLENYCSQCYKKIHPVKMDICNVKINTNNKISEEKNIEIENKTNENKCSQNIKKRKRIRCNICKKKLVLYTQFECPNCKTITCSVHRYHEEHNCPHLDEMLERKSKQLKKSLPMVIASKIEKL